jgi:hypothetical protein
MGVAFEAVFIGLRETGKAFRGNGNKNFLFAQKSTVLAVFTRCEPSRHHLLRGKEMVLAPVG